MVTIKEYYNFSKYGLLFGTKITGLIFLALTGVAYIVALYQGKLIFNLSDLFLNSAGAIFCSFGLAVLIMLIAFFAGYSELKKTYKLFVAKGENFWSEFHFNLFIENSTKIRLARYILIGNWNLYKIKVSIDFQFGNVHIIGDKGESQYQNFAAIIPLGKWMKITESDFEQILLKESNT